MNSFRAEDHDSHTVPFDVASLGRWLDRNGVAVNGTVGAQRIGHGHSNLTYLIKDEAGSRWVARRAPLGRLLASAHDVAREYKVLSALSTTDVPVPGVIGLAQDLGVSDVPVLVVEFIDGLVVDRIEVAKGLVEPHRRRIGTDLADILARLHRVNVEYVDLADLASHAPYAPRQLKRWTRQWEASRTRDIPALDRVTRWLHTHLPQEREVVVVHGDLHIRNVILDHNDSGVVAALDWELCTLGDPLADLGTTLAYWTEDSDQSRGLFDASSLPGFSTRSEIVEAYSTASGRDIESLRFWYVLGLWKIAVIAQGVRRRAMEEPSNASAGGPPGDALIEGLIAQAWAAALHPGDLF